MVTIISKDNPILRQKAHPVPIGDIATPKIQKIVADMQRALHREDDGVAIAAPQIGVPLRIFVVSGKIFDADFVREEKKEFPADKKWPDDMVCVNPKITRRSKETKWVPEGCLSVRWLYGDTKRNVKVTLEAHDERGKKFTRGASGLLAQIFQHETDHLDGILFIDHARDIEDLPPKQHK